MLEQTQVYQLLQSPLGAHVEARFVRSMRKKQRQGCSCTFSFQRFLELLGNDLTFEEIGVILGVPYHSISNYYERYCVQLFNGETGLKRRSRIAEERKLKKVSELQSSPITNPLLVKIADLARKQGCTATAHVNGTQFGRTARISSRALYINGMSCRVHVLRHCQYKDSTKTSEPYSYVHLYPRVILDFEWQIICTRIRGISDRNYIVRSSVILNRLFKEAGTKPKLLRIPLGIASRGSGVLDIRPYHNRFDTIKDV